MSSTGTLTSPLGFAGGYTDAETGFDYLVHRYYDPASDQFLSVDPLVSGTKQPYSYATGNPVGQKDPTGAATLGICGSGTIGAIAASVSGEGCLVRTVAKDGTDEIGFVGTLGGAVGVAADWSLGVYYQVSNADHLDQLRRWFTYGSVAGDAGLGFGINVFWNYTPTINTLGRKLPVFGADLGVSVGIGVTAVVGESYTWVNQLSGFDAWLARGFWDAANPGIPIVQSLARATRAITKLTNGGC
jgi:RHS repeat-associated protein